jgi:hypothetical protein
MLKLTVRLSPGPSDETSHLGEPCLRFTEFWEYALLRRHLARQHTPNSVNSATCRCRVIPEFGLNLYASDKYTIATKKQKLTRLLQFFYFFLKLLESKTSASVKS